MPLGMTTQQQDPGCSLSRRRNWSPIVNLVFGIALWFGFVTDFSWDNVWANVFFPPFVALFGIVSLLAGRRGLTCKERRIRSLCCLLSLIGGLPYTVLIVFAIASPFLLYALFWVSEQSMATLIQRAESPDGLRVAEVYFLPVGAYSPGSGRIEVHLKYPWLPFVKRDIAYVRVTYADEETRDYVSWTDSETLYIPERDAQVEVGWIEWKIPSIVLLPSYVICSFLLSS